MAAVPTTIDLTSTVVLVKCLDDNTTRQVALSRENSPLLLRLLAELEGGQISLSSEPLDVEIQSRNG